MFGSESKLFPKQSKIGRGSQNSQYPGRQPGDIPEWNQSYQYLLNQEVFHKDTYYRCLAPHISEDFSTDYSHGYWKEMFTIPSLGVNYSNVIFVDAVNGDDSTAQANDFTKPALTLFQATAIATSLTPSSADRVLIYVRRGSYTLYAGIYDSIDYYSEPGVQYTSGTITNTAFDISCNFLGHAQLWNSSIYITRASNFNIEFDFINNNRSAIYIAPSSGTANVNFKGNYIYSATVGSGYGISIRYNSNVTFNMMSEKGIEAVHSTFSFRYYTGKTTINSNIFLAPGNVYGGNYKQAIVCYDGSTSGTVIVNGNIENNDTVNYGGIGSLVTIYSGANPKLKINGNLKGGPIKALDGNTQTSATVEINGDISSDNAYTLFAYGAGELLFKNGVIKNSGADVTSQVAAVNGTAKVFFKDCYLYNKRVDSNLIAINGPSTNLVLDGCQGVSEGAGGNCVASTIGAVNVRFHNSRFNKDKSADITDLYSPSGFIKDSATIVPTSI